MKASITATAALLIAAACTAGGVDGPTRATQLPTTTLVATTTETNPTDVAVDPAEPTPSETVEPLGDAAWTALPLPRADVPAVFAEQWGVAENRLWCSALAPESLGPEGAEAVPRAANFGGGWAVAWDNPDGPGSSASSEYCPDCGRSAFGIAGVHGLVEPDTAIRMPTVLEWSDGSKAGYAGEGFDPSNPKLLGEIAIAGQGCVYQVWSHLGAAHIEQLRTSLRFVEGLRAEPVTLRDRGASPQLIEGGPAPWVGSRLSVEDVPRLLLGEWEKASADRQIPLVVFSDLGEGLDDAQIRTANVGSYGVAWDNPSGPGHDGGNQSCLECGRGVIGLGANRGSANTFVVDPVRIEWDDGSYAEYGRRLADNRLPWDRIIFNDPATGEPTQDALEATVVIAGSNITLTVWSHLGEEHLLHLIESLRLVDL